jgi:hypothetical protein
MRSRMKRTNEDEEVGAWEPVELDIRNFVVVDGIVVEDENIHRQGIAFLVESLAWVDVPSDQDWDWPSIPNSGSRSLALTFDGNSPVGPEPIVQEFHTDSVEVPKVDVHTLAYMMVRPYCMFVEVDYDYRTEPYVDVHYTHTEASGLVVDYTHKSHTYCNSRKDLP